MILFGRVLNANTGIGIPYANIEVTDDKGTFAGVGTSSGVTGSFALDSLMMREGSFLRITSSGYKPVSIPFSTYSNVNDFILIPDYVELPGVVVTAKKQAASNNNYAIFAALGIGALFLLMKKR